MYNNKKITGIVDRIVELFDDLIQQTDAEITYDPLPMIVADGDQLEMLFHVLIENSLMFSSESGCRIHIKAQDIEKEQLTTVLEQVTQISITEFTIQKILN